MLPYIIALISIIVVALLIVVLIKKLAFLKHQRDVGAEQKGEIGEQIVAKELGETIYGKQYVINDLMFINNAGRSCQIDHIYINKFGIWVIETKNYSGRIYGNENQKNWIQFSNKGKKFKHYNPIIQNETHANRIANYLHAKSFVKNLVVFLPNADISKVNAKNVCKIDKLKFVLNQNNGTILSNERMEYFYNRLLQLKNDSKISKQEHINKVLLMQYKIQKNICPNCGAKLVMRNGKNGKFYGCPNYPKCKFTKNID